MKYLYIKNIRNLNILKNFELSYIKLKYFLYNENYNFFIRQKILMILNNFLLYKKTFVNIKLRCLLTNKARSCFKFFKLSRIKLRQLKSFGFINGIKKAS
jgi:small subunit ribosomal protein S14